MWLIQGKNTVDVPIHSVKQPLIKLEDFNEGLEGWAFIRMWELHRAVVTLMSLPCCVLWWWKNCDLSVAAYRKGTLFSSLLKKNKKKKKQPNKTKQMVPIKNPAANVNQIIVTRLREVYSDLGWLPWGVMTQSVGLNLILMVRSKCHCAAILFQK